MLTLLDKAKLLDVTIKMFKRKLIIIVYHNIGEGNSESYYFEEPLPVRLLEEHIRYFLKNRFIITSLRDALLLIAKANISKPIVALTFDDGYRGVYKYAYPLLRRYNIKATVYLTAGFVENRILPWWEQLYYIFREAFIQGKINEINNILPSIYQIKTVDLNYIKDIVARIVRSGSAFFISSIIKKLSNYLGIKVPGELYDKYMLKIDEIKEMTEYGIEVGGHGVRHVNLTRLRPDEVKEEIQGSLKFTKKYSDCFLTFAYPFGLYNEYVIKILESQGYSAAVTLQPGMNTVPVNNLFELRRLPPYRYRLKDILSLKISIINSIINQ